MATFLDPKYGQQKRSAPITRTGVADGYEHRIILDCRTSKSKVFNLTFEVTETEADTIETLDARAGTESFDFTPPGEASSSKFVCEGWSKSIPYL